MQCTVLIRKSLPQRRSQLMDLMEKGAYFTDLLTDSESLALKKDAFAKLPQGSMLIDEEGHLPGQSHVWRFEINGLGQRG